MNTYITNLMASLSMLWVFVNTSSNISFISWQSAGADPGGGAPGARPPLKLEKIWFVGVKSWFFTRNTPTIFAPPSTIGKNMIFWRKIVIFHKKYPNNYRASLRSAQFFWYAPPLIWYPRFAPGQFYMWWKPK